jgi:hypothetical protein
MHQASSATLFLRLSGEGAPPRGILFATSCVQVWLCNSQQQPGHGVDKGWCLVSNSVYLLYIFSISSVYEYAHNAVAGQNYR